MDSVEEGSRYLVDAISLYGLKVLGAIIMLVVGFWISGFVYRTIKKALLKTGKCDEMLAGFLSAFVKYVIVAVTLLAVLNNFGVETTSLIAVMGAAGLAIGLALQGTLSNVAAGVMLLFLRPFKVSDFVEVGSMAGTVKGVSLFTTELATPDNVKIIMPNSQVWNSAIKNYSGHDTRRVDLIAGISYEDDIDQAMAILEKLTQADDRIKTDPAPVLAVGELADSSVNLIVRVWVDAPNYWGVKWDMTKAIKQTFDKEGISIPFPQRDVHLIETKS